MKGEATVVKHTGSHYLLAQLPDWNLFPAVLRGKIRLKGSSATNPVAVGDVVTFEADVPELREDGQIRFEDGSRADIEHMTLENPAAITAVHPRKNYIIRKSTNLSRQSHIIAANLDRAFIIATIDYPEIKLPFLDRILVTCEVYNIPVTIVLNKVDLYRESHAEMLAAFHEIYEGAGYPVMEVSALTGEGIDALRDACRGNVSLFSGVSGVGKSSLIKALDPSLDPRVGEISDVHLQGKHTTTFYEMYALTCQSDPACQSEPSCHQDFTIHPESSAPSADSACHPESSAPSADSACHPESSLPACHPELSAPACHPERSEGSLQQKSLPHSQQCKCQPERSEESPGFIVDTPGLRGFGLVDLKKEEIALYFPEMLKASENCRFTPCTHTHEPGCAVKEAVENGDISYERYSSYLGMLDDEGKYR